MPLGLARDRGNFECLLLPFYMLICIILAWSYALFPHDQMYYPYLGFSDPDLHTSRLTVIVVFPYKRSQFRWETP